VAFTLHRIERVYRHYEVTATLADGGPATLPGVTASLIPPGYGPGPDTDWWPAVYADGTVTVLLAGPDADPADGAVVIPAAGVNLWFRIVDTPEIVARLVERITVR
jgi:hypothetical protein